MAGSSQEQPVNFARQYRGKSSVNTHANVEWLYATTHYLNAPAFRSAYSRAKQIRMNVDLMTP